MTTIKFLKFWHFSLMNICWSYSKPGYKTVIGFILLHIVAVLCQLCVLRDCVEAASNPDNSIFSWSVVPDRIVILDTIFSGSIKHTKMIITVISYSLSIVIFANFRQASVKKNILNCDWELTLPRSSIWTCLSKEQPAKEPFTSPLTPNYYII